jgi:ATP-dependent RNA helicase RhlE
MASFKDFPLSGETLDGIHALGFEEPLPIQVEVIPAALEGRDIIGCSQTGSGKTAAYLIPIIEDLLEMQPATRFRPRVLVLTPTRELAQQVGTHFEALAQFTRLRGVVVHGGVDIHPQDRQLQEGAELLIATPGRLIEHLGRGGLKLNRIEYLVIDEADRMLDEGFLPELRTIIDTLPDRRQTMLFSATIPREMEQLARDILYRPQRIQIGIVGPAANIEESFWPVPEHQKTELLKQIIAQQEQVDKLMVFVRTRAKARSLTPELRELTGLPTAELHAELTQQERDAAMNAFRAGEIRLLVATDVAARGLDVPQVTHVVNYDVPNTPDDYIHRIGRTGRVDRPGVAITLVSPRELALSAAIEEILRRSVPTNRMTGFEYDVVEEPDLFRSPKKKSSARAFRDRKPTDPGGKKKSPFTKTGQLLPEFREDDQERKPKRNYKKRMEKRILRKKLPHQRKRKG